MKKFWYLNQKELGDLLKCPPAYKAITQTLNNLGLYYKQFQQVQQSLKYFKQMLEIEEAIKADIEIMIEELEQRSKRPGNELNKRYNDISIEVGCTTVNLCCLYSNIQKHDIALTFAKRANVVLEKIFKEEVSSIIPFK